MLWGVIYKLTLGPLYLNLSEHLRMFSGQHVSQHSVYNNIRDMKIQGSSLDWTVSIPPVQGSWDGRINGKAR